MWIRLVEQCGHHAKGHRLELKYGIYLTFPLNPKDFGNRIILQIRVYVHRTFFSGTMTKVSDSIGKIRENLIVSIKIVGNGAGHQYLKYQLDVGSTEDWLHTEVVLQAVLVFRLNRD